MDTVWAAYVRDRRHSLYQINPKKYSWFADLPDTEVIIGIFDSQDKAERALNIVFQRIGWHGKAYRPNTWAPPDRYEYGWRAIPFNQFNVNDLYSLCKFMDGRK